MIVEICEDCHQFNNRAIKWNKTYGVTDPIPYIDDIVKSHKHLIFEKRRVDGAGWTSFIFQCQKCEQWWELFTWPAVGQLDVRPYQNTISST
jgi:hypothetical protein